MRIRLVLLLSLILLVATRVAAQTGDDWYLAWTLDGQLISFAADGAPKTLFESGVNSGPQAWRMDDGSVLAILETTDSDIWGLFHITRDAAQPILDLSGEPIAVNDDYWRFLTKGNYAVLIAGERIPSGAALLVNATTNTGTTLEQQVSFFLDHSAAFSEDGAYFRYVGRETVDTTTWTLRERTLETGAERAFYTIEADTFPLTNTDVYGEQWIYRLGLAITMISRSGDIQTTLYESPKQSVQQRYVGDHMMSYPLDCGAGCQIVWTPLSGGDPLTFTMPESDAIQIPNPLAQIDDNHLLVMIDTETLWLLSTDGTSLKLGDWSAQTLATLPNKLMSPDQRWLMTANNTDDGPIYQVLDLHTLKPVLQSDPAQVFQIVQINYSAGGFIVSEDALRFHYFRYSDQKAFDLGEPGGTFWNVQPDGALLYAQFGGKGERPRGIYRYDPDTQTFTSLVDGGIPVVIQEQ